VSCCRDIQFLPVQCDSQSTLVSSNQTGNNKEGANLDEVQDPHMSRALGNEAAAGGGLGSHYNLDAGENNLNWAAVGATATLMSAAAAGAVSSGGDTTEDTGSKTSSSAGLLGVEAERAAELDRLVDTGDWEGVVLAASKFETESVGSSSAGGESHDTRSFDEAEFAAAAYGAVGGVGVASPSPTRDNDRPAASVVSPAQADPTSPSRSVGSGTLTSGSGSSRSSASGTISEDDDEEGSESFGPSSGILSKGGSTNYTGEASGASDSASALQKRAEIREEVEALVRRVVPDEIDNIDEMMNQFKGREEELVETLRTMQERQIAQRERAARNKSAKMEAKRDVRQKRKLQAAMAASSEGLAAVPPNEVTPVSEEGGEGSSPAMMGGDDDDAPPMARFRHRAPSPGNVSDVGSDFSDPDFAPRIHAATTSTRYDADGEGSDFETDDDQTAQEGQEVIMSMGPVDTPLDQLQARERLAQAVEAGDWEAVGELGALMGADASVTSASTNGKGDLSEYDSSGYSSTGGGDGSANEAQVAELDSLIEAGNWEGVVLAAKKYSNSPDANAEESASEEDNTPEHKQEPKSKSWRVTRLFAGRKFSSRSAQSDSNDDSEETDSASQKDADKALQEEQDALAQAEIWMAIAAQSKQEGSTEAKGASDAADWAIQRSLTALQTAENGGDGAEAGVKDDTSV
jgi:hypothetical protein